MEKIGKSYDNSKNPIIFMQMHCILYVKSLLLILICPPFFSFSFDFRLKIALFCDFSCISRKNVVILQPIVLYLYWDIIGWLLGYYWVIIPLVGKQPAHHRRTKSIYQHTFPLTA